jgi:hypothetical protein
MKVSRLVAVAAVLLVLGCNWWEISTNKPKWSLTGTWVGSGMTLQLTDSTEGYPPLTGLLTMADGSTLHVGGYHFPGQSTLDIYAPSLASFTFSMDDANHLSGTLDGYVWTRTPIAFTRSP